MMRVKAGGGADTIFKVFGMTQLRIKPSLRCFAGERSIQERSASGMAIYEYACKDCPKLKLTL